MAPKKKGGGKGNKGNKKATKDDDEVFAEFLDDMFFVSGTQKDARREILRAKIRDSFSVFQERGRDLADIRELGTIVRDLGLNPSTQNLQWLANLVDDPETGNFVQLSRFEPVMVDILMSHELKIGDGPLNRCLLYKESEGVVQAAFDSLWDSMGRKCDQDNARYIDGEPLRELLMKQSLEAFNEDDLQHFLVNALDVGTTFVKEDPFVNMMME